MLELFLPVPFHAFFGVAIMMSDALVVTTFAHPPAGWGVDLLGDQGEAGGIVWAFGELPTVLVLGVVFFSWASSEERRAGRSTGRRPHHDAELEAYNARLRALAERRPADASDSGGVHHGLVGQVLLGGLDQHARTTRAPSTSSTAAQVKAVV